MNNSSGRSKSGAPKYSGGGKKTNIGAKRGGTLTITSHNVSDGKVTTKKTLTKKPSPSYSNKSKSMDYSKTTKSGRRK